jgi:hypothetical protein
LQLFKDWIHGHSNNGSPEDQENKGSDNIETPEHQQKYKTNAYRRLDYSAMKELVICGHV